jgi:hypothetical protein
MAAVTGDSTPREAAKRIVPNQSALLSDAIFGGITPMNLGLERSSTRGLPISATSQAWLVAALIVADLAIIMSALTATGLFVSDHKAAVLLAGVGAAAGLQRATRSESPMPQPLGGCVTASWRCSAWDRWL